MDKLGNPETPTEARMTEAGAMRYAPKSPATVRLRLFVFEKKRWWSKSTTRFYVDCITTSDRLPVVGNAIIIQQKRSPLDIRFCGNSSYYRVMDVRYPYTALVEENGAVKQFPTVDDEIDVVVFRVDNMDTNKPYRWK